MGCSIYHEHEADQERQNSVFATVATRLPACQPSEYIVAVYHGRVLWSVVFLLLKVLREPPQLTNLAVG